MRKKVIAALAVLILACLLTACGEKETSLAAYAIGEDQVVSLDSIMDEGEAMLTSVESPTEEAEAEGIIQYTYHYRKMADPAALSAEYISVLRGSEQGFTMTDSENRRLAQEPDLETLSGEIILEKKSASEERKIFKVIVAWSEYAMAIQVSRLDGSILPPPVEEKEDEAAAAQPTGIIEQAEFFNSLRPSDIGLEGDDMNDYMVYPKEGWVLVDGKSCRELTVYLKDALSGNNVYMGTYYLSSDLQQLFRRNSDSSIVRLSLNN